MVVDVNTVLSAQVIREALTCYRTKLYEFLNNYQVKNVQANDMEFIKNISEKIDETFFLEQQIFDQLWKPKKINPLQYPLLI